MTVDEAHAFFSNVQLSESESQIGTPILREIRARLDFLRHVGLNYLQIDRSAATLSGGEAQRIRLASQVGSGLQGVTYVLGCMAGIRPDSGFALRDRARLGRRTRHWPFWPPIIFWRLVPVQVAKAAGLSTKVRWTSS